MVGTATTGVPPRIIKGIGQAPATWCVLELTGPTLARMDVID